MISIQDFALLVAVGIGATLVMDAWLVFLRRIGVASLNFAMIGRWVGHLLRGTFSHAAIAKSPPIAGELALGWVTHYAIGIAFAGLLVGVQGVGWLHNPSPYAAIALGMLTVAAPLFVMQPAMGAGFASSRTPAPLRNCARSLVNHTVFGFGLYVSAIAIERISQ